MTYLTILFVTVVGGFIATLSFTWMLASMGIGYAALRALANYDARFLDVILVALSKTPATPSWFKGKGFTYRA